MFSLDTENKIVIEVGQQFNISDDTDEPRNYENDARNSAARIVRHAERQAEEIKSNAIIAAAQKQEAIQKKAEAEAARLLEESRNKGYKEGMDTAIVEGEKIKARAQQVLEDANAERKRMQENLEPEIVSMIIGITEKLLGNITALNPAVIINLIKQGFEASTISGSVKVYVSADDYDTVIKNKDELTALTDGSVMLEIVKDLSLSPMDCVIETPFGDIDCSLGQQFETLRANLTYILNNK